MIRNSIASGQQIAGTTVAQIIANVASSHIKSSIKDTVKSIFGLTNDYDDMMNFWRTSDDLLSTMMRVYRSQVSTYEALLLFFEEVSFFLIVGFVVGV